jgi:hypothetical protein
MKSLRQLALSAIAAGAVLVSMETCIRAADAVPSAADAALTNKSLDLLDTAFKLKKLGWGVEKKGIIEGGSIESLLTAARLLKEVPKPSTIKGEPEVGKEKDAPAGTDTALSNAKPIDLAAEAKETLERARLLVERTVTDPKKKEAYETLLADAEKFSGTKEVRGGPKAIKRSLTPGQSHTYQWVWEEQLPGSVTFRSDIPVRVRIVRVETDEVYSQGTGTSGSFRFTLNGRGPARTVKLHVRVSNTSDEIAYYELFAN